MNKQSYPRFNIILVNNGMKNIFLPKKRFKNTKITLLNLKKNIGFCRGVNLGIRLALKSGADQILLLNNDILLDVKTIEKLSHFMQRNEKIGLLSPIIMQEKNKRLVWYAGGYTNKLFGFTRNCGINKPISAKIKSGPTGTISGCCVLVKRGVFEKIGLWEEDYFLYFDDPDFSLKAEKAGFRSYLLAEPLIWHKKENNKLSPVEAYFFARNPFIFIRKNFKGFYKITSILGQFIIRLPYNLLRLKNKKGIKPYFLGLWDGIIGKKGAPNNFQNLRMG